VSVRVSVCVRGVKVLLSCAVAMWMSRMFLDVSDVWVNFLLFVRVVRVDDVRTTNLVLRSDPTRGRDSLSPRFLFFSIVSSSVSLFSS
jgi:hypothetical protein